MRGDGGICPSFLSVLWDKGVGSPRSAIRFSPKGLAAEANPHAFWEILFPKFSIIIHVVFANGGYKLVQVGPPSLIFLHFDDARKRFFQRRIDPCDLLVSLFLKEAESCQSNFAISLASSKVKLVTGAPSGQPFITFNFNHRGLFHGSVHISSFPNQRRKKDPL